MHITGDLLFGFIPRLIEPTDPDSHAQNVSVVLAMTRAATAFVAGGYDVYLDAVVGPWFLPVVARKRCADPHFEAVGPYEKHVINICARAPDEVLARFHQLRYRCLLDINELADTME